MKAEISINGEPVKTLHSPMETSLFIHSHLTGSRPDSVYVDINDEPDHFEEEVAKLYPLYKEIRAQQKNIISILDAIEERNQDD